MIRKRVQCDGECREGTCMVHTSIRSWVLVVGWIGWISVSAVSSYQLPVFQCGGGLSYRVDVLPTTSLTD